MVPARAPWPAALHPALHRNPRLEPSRLGWKRPPTEPERLFARRDAVNRCLEELSAGRTHTPESDEVGEEERGLLEELDQIEGRVGELQRPRLD